MSIFACPSSFQTVKKHGSSGGQVVSVLAFTPTIRVRIPLTPTVFSLPFSFILTTKILSF